MGFGKVSKKYMCRVDDEDFMIFDTGDGMFDIDPDFYFEIFNRNFDTGKMDETCVCLTLSQVEELIAELEDMVRGHRVVMSAEKAMERNDDALRKLADTDENSSGE